MAKVSYGEKQDQKAPKRIALLNDSFGNRRNLLSPGDRKSCAAVTDSENSILKAVLNSQQHINSTGKV